MPVTLRRPLNDWQSRALIDGVPERSRFMARLDDEVVEVVSVSTAGIARILRGRFDTIRSAHPAGTPLVDQTWVAGDAPPVVVAGRLELHGTGQPASGASGTGAPLAAPGSRYTDLASGVIYVNIGTAESPAWHGSDQPAGVTLTPNQQAALDAAPALSSSNPVASLADVQLAVAGDKSFAHHQAVASDTWLVAHNLGKMPAVTVIDSARNQVIGDVTYVDLDHLVVQFSAPFSGVATCN